jgi:integrase
MFYYRAKTGKAFHQPMSRAVHAHLKAIVSENPRPEVEVFLGGGAPPNGRFQEFRALAGIRPKTNIETGIDEPWELKGLRKTCATYYDEHVPKSSVELLGHSVGRITWTQRNHRC